MVLLFLLPISFISVTECACSYPPGVNIIPPGNRFTIESQITRSGYIGRLYIQKNYQIEFLLKLNSPSAQSMDNNLFLLTASYVASAQVLGDRIASLAISPSNNSPILSVEGRSFTLPSLTTDVFNKITINFNQGQLSVLYNDIMRFTDTTGPQYIGKAILWFSSPYSPPANAIVKNLTFFYNL